MEEGKEDDQNIEKILKKNKLFKHTPQLHVPQVGSILSVKHSSNLSHCMLKISCLLDMATKQRCLTLTFLLRKQIFLKCVPLRQLRKVKLLGVLQAHGASSRYSSLAPETRLYSSMNILQEKPFGNIPDRN